MSIAEEEWRCNLEFDINDIRALYEVINYALQTWPGAPARPHDEQVYLHYMRNMLFAMLQDYNFTYK